MFCGLVFSWFRLCLLFENKKTNTHFDCSSLWTFLQLVSPGAWLSDLCQERYEVREKKSSKKVIRISYSFSISRYWKYIIWFKTHEFMQRTRGRGILKLWATATDGYFSIEIEQSQKNHKKLRHSARKFCLKYCFLVRYTKWIIIYWPFYRDLKWISVHKKRHHHENYASHCSVWLLCHMNWDGDILKRVIHFNAMGWWCRDLEDWRLWEVWKAIRNEKKFERERWRKITGAGWCNLH